LKFTAWYSITVGVLMLAQWGFFLATGQVPELQAEPYRIAFHLLGEGATAIALIASGIALLRRAYWSRQAAYTSLGMLTYTVLVSPGYFAQLGQWPLVVMFAVLLLLTLLSFVLLGRGVNFGS
jgi:NADH:ubiquinone oxidoreductase subunit 2 (subunit N)